MIRRIVPALKRVSVSTVVTGIIFFLVAATVVAGIAVLMNDRSELIRTNRALIEQVTDSGGTPVVSSPSEVVQGAAGEPGRPPTDAEIRAAVNDYCSIGSRCLGARGQAGPAGPAGADGMDGATGAQGAASTVPGPAGQAGRAGVDGAAGADSTVPGPAGPQGPQGDPGAQGPQGVAGADGRSVSAVRCEMNGVATDLVFLDQDGTEIGRVQTICTPT